MSAESERRTETIPEWKREEVDDIVAMLEDYDSVGVVDIEGIPSRQLQAMRRDLHGTAELRVSRNTLMIRALEAVSNGLSPLTDHVTGQVGLIGTNHNPFSLYRQLEASKTPAPINAGELAPSDIVIPGGDTGIEPGPFVGELQQVGADARIDEGSIKVLSESTVLTAGEEVSAQLANVLAELGIEPKEVGLDLRAVYSDGVLFEPDELDIDLDSYRRDIQSGVAAGRSLSIGAGVPTSRTVGAMLALAATKAKSLGVHTAVESPDLADDLVATADAHVRALIDAIDDDALPPELAGINPEPAAEADAAGEEATEQDGDPSAGSTDAEEPTADADEADEDDGGADALGDMFG